jgi:hypothetical protein
MLDSLSTGADVITLDGHKIGSVKEVYGRWFKVDAKFQMDYWLSCDLVSEATAETVTVAFEKDALVDYKSDYPDDAVAPAGVVEGTSPVTTHIDPSGPVESVAQGQLRIGCELYTQDGDHIGSVSELSGNYFKVRAPMTPDFWLETNLVSLVDDIVGLSVTRAELDDYKLARLPDDDTGEGFSAPTGAGITFYETAKSEEHMPN